jgi:hypothetical protein
MSTLAIFIALGGSAWAVSLERNSVTGKHLARESVSSSELKPDGAKGRDVAEETLATVPSAANADSAAYAQTADTAYSADTAFSADTALSADTATSVGPDGVDTAAVQDGAVKAGELGAIKVRVNDGTLGGPGSTAFLQVTCRPEERLLGGGAFLDADAATAADAQVLRSSPNPGGTGWQGGFYNGNTQGLYYAVRVLCLEG